MAAPLRIPLLKPDPLHSEVEIFPDELPMEVDEILDPLVAEYAPLSSWKAVAVRYFVWISFICLP